MFSPTNLYVKINKICFNTLLNTVQIPLKTVLLVTYSIRSRNVLNDRNACHA